MIVTNKANYTPTVNSFVTTEVPNFDILVRTGNFPTQGRKLVIQKGNTTISVPAEDVLAFLSACANAAQDLND